MKDVNPPAPHPKVCVIMSRTRVEHSIEHLIKCTKTLTSPPLESNECDHVNKPCVDANESHESIKTSKNTEFATGGGS